jgi:hypothetical protein
MFNKLNAHEKLITKVALPLLLILILADKSD